MRVQAAACSDLFLLLCEARCDRIQLGAPDADDESGVALWAAAGCEATAVAPGDLCGALRAVQAPQHPKSVLWLRAQQCLLVLEGQGGGRGEGMPLWGK